MRATTIGEIAEIFDGPHATPTRTSEGPYFLNISSLNSGRLDLEQSDHVAAEDFEKWTKRVTPQADDMLFSYETRLGEAALMPEGLEACLGRRMALLRFDRRVVDPKYFLYFYLSPLMRSLIEARTIHGATVNRIALSTMADWEIRLPTLAVQLAIAEVLGALDDKIAANRKLMGTSTELSDLLVRQCPVRVPMADVVEYRKVSRSPERMNADMVAHFSLHAFDNGQLPEMTPPGEIKSAKFLIERPSVLVSKLNPRFPRVWDIGRLPVEPAYSSTEFLVLESPHCSTSVLAALLRHPQVSSQLELKVAGTSGSHQRVKPVDLLATEIPDPRVVAENVQESITSMGRLVDDLRVESRHLATLRDTLLPRLMSGELRVRDAERVVEAAV